MSDRDLAWLVGIHMVFVVSGLLMALTDRLIAGHHDR
ncbi:putative membrane protein YqhA [Methylobacterium goesingense]|uniref:Membrane protein YqhA n=2 Tax=Methylobacterium TaxID=407 RepID=A0ABV2KZI6_9HYPH